MPTSLNKLKNYLILLGSLLAVIFLVPTVILPQIQTISENWKIVSQNKDRLDNLETKAEALEKLAAASEELDRNLAIAESALPIEKDVARLVRGVQNLAVASGLEVSKVSIQPGRTATASATPTASTTTNTSNTTTNSEQNTQSNSTSTTTTTTSPKTELIFELSLRGNLESFQSFLKSVESTKRLLILSSLKVSSDSGSNFAFNVVIDAPFGQLPKIAEDQLAAAIEDLSQNNEKLLKDLESSIFKNVTNDPLPTGPTGVADPFR